MVAEIKSASFTRRRVRLGDLLFFGGAKAAASVMLLLIILTIAELIQGSRPVLASQPDFFTSTKWIVQDNAFGALAPAWGTLVSSVLALLIGGSIGLSLSAYLVELAPKGLLKPISFLVDLLAAIPSIIYGLWGFFVLVPFLKKSVYPELHEVFGWTGVFGPKSAGTGLLTAGIVLAVMIIPTVAAITREILTVVPKSMRDGALALGATRTEALKSVQIPYGIAGILGALILGLGRALGETMAVTMVIGNSPAVQGDLFRPAATLSSMIAVEFGEAGGLQRSALMGLGLMLFAVTLLLNVMARWLVWRVRLKSGVTR